MNQEPTTRRSFLQLLGLAFIAALVPSKLLSNLGPPPVATSTWVEPVTGTEMLTPGSFFTVPTNWSNCSNSTPLADFRRLRKEMMEKSYEPRVTYLTPNQYAELERLSASERSALRRMFGTFQALKG